MRHTRGILAAALVALMAGCEPDPAAPALEAGTEEPGALLLAPKAGHMQLNGGAVVHKDEIGCRLYDGAGNWFPADGSFSLPCGIEVANKNHSIIHVRASGVPNPTGKLVVYGPYDVPQLWADEYPMLDGPPYPCFVLGMDYDLDNPLYTVNWWQTVTPSGEAALHCHWSKRWEFQWPG